MNAQYLLKEVKKASEISLDERTLFEIAEFKTAKEEKSIESLALILGGHQPIKNYSFDIKKFENWCEENSLRFYLCERQRILHLKMM